MMRRSDVRIKCLNFMVEGKVYLKVSTRADDDDDDVQIGTWCCESFKVNEELSSQRLIDLIRLYSR